MRDSMPRLVVGNDLTLYKMGTEIVVFGVNNRVDSKHSCTVVAKQGDPLDHGWSCLSGLPGRSAA
jgi:hypothetical protein